MKIRIKCYNPIIDKIDRVINEKYEAIYIDTNIENMGKDFYNAIKNGEFDTCQNTFTIEIEDNDKAES